MSKEKVLIFDTTLRDGEQSAGAGLTVNEKLEIANQLNLLGVDIIEAGFAASSEGDFDAVKKISNSLSGTTKVAFLARCNPEDIKKAGLWSQYFVDATLLGRYWGCYEDVFLWFTGKPRLFSPHSLIYFAETGNVPDVVIPS